MSVVESERGSEKEREGEITHSMHLFRWPRLPILLLCAFYFMSKTGVFNMCTFAKMYIEVPT